MVSPGLSSGIGQAFREVIDAMPLCGLCCVAAVRAVGGGKVIGAFAWINS